ncbi:hypothetical protein [Grimontia marina]|uniref:Polymerase nucleotidyl transferase domain-containing protein n=1 Tax=Grimontia marina TaxID=646534 RepID=A0A128F6X5_9GAMM|nr:hypothetical protein [Grimontia marina]CZF82532.1 hypothetical protein GMA8713_02261 [Grimontia marina]
MYQNKPRGGLLPELDNEKPFQPVYVEPIAAATRQIQSAMSAELFHSLYLSGNVARREAGETEDLTLLLVSTRSLNVQEYAALNTVRWRIEQSSDAVKRVLIDVVPLKEITNLANIFRWGFFLKHCAVCIAGDNLSKSFGHFEVSWEVSKAMNDDLARRLKDLRHKIAIATKWGAQLDASHEVAERLIRASFGLVAHKVQKWEFDLKPASEAFLAYYPDKSLEIERLFYLIERKPVKKRAVVALIDSFSAWVESEYAKIDRKIG